MSEEKVHNENVNRVASALGCVCVTNRNIRTKRPGFNFKNPELNDEGPLSLHSFQEALKEETESAAMEV
jgi:hypothetical protein